MKIALVGQSALAINWMERLIIELEKQCKKNLAEGENFFRSLEFTHAVSVSEVHLPSVAPEKLVLIQYVHEQRICHQADLVICLNDDLDWSTAKINHMNRLLERTPALLVWIPETVILTESVSAKDLENKIGLMIVHDTLVNMATMAMYILSDDCLLTED